jgi:hypothetical protein
MSWIWGTVLPFIGRVITPCDEHGVPAMEPDEFTVAQFETHALILAWLGRCTAIAYGKVEPRAIDPANPRSWRRGDLWA